MRQTRVGQILNKLMADKKIRVADLARRIKLPQPTIHRISTGMCEHPHMSSLVPIANFFSITIDQLKGHEPISWLDRASKVPLLTWIEALKWPVNKSEIQHAELILTDAAIGKNAFALRVQDASMEPVFPKNTVLIADPEKVERDRSFIIAELENHPEAVFRQLLIDAGDRYLKSLNPDFDRYKMTKINSNGRILGVIAQAKRDYEE